MTFLRNLILFAMGSMLAMPAQAVNTVDQMDSKLVGNVAQMPSPLQDYEQAIKDILLDVNMIGAAKALVLSNREYNRTIPGVRELNRYRTQYFVPDRVAELLVGSPLCDIPQYGACLVVEKDMDAKPTAYYVAAAYTNIDDIQIFRKEVNTKKFAEQIQFLLTYQQVNSMVYSQVSADEDLVRKHKFKSDKADDSEPVVPVVPEEPQEPTPVDSDEAKILAEKAQIKDAIMDGCPYHRDENGKKIRYQKVYRKTGKPVGNGRTYTKKTCVPEGLIENHTPVMTQVTETEAAELEKEAELIFRKGNASFKEVRNRNVKKGVVTCYPVAKIEVQRPRLSIGINIFWSPSRTKPDIYGKGKLLCYKDGQMTHRINMEMKYFYGAIGLAAAIPEGTHYATGLLSLGTAESPISLLTTKLKDGTLEPYREWHFAVSADANFIFGLGTELFGFSAGADQKPILNIISGSARVGTVGVGASAFSTARIGLDPDDF